MAKFNVSITNWLKHLFLSVCCSSLSFVLRYLGVGGGNVLSVLSSGQCQLISHLSTSKASKFVLLLGPAAFSITQSSRRVCTCCAVNELSFLAAAAN